MPVYKNRHPRASAGQTEPPRRTPPKGMPSEPPKGQAVNLRGHEKPRDVLPEQKPVTDVEVVEKKPAKWRVVLVRVLTALLLLIVLALGYVFLLLGEPDEEAKLATPVAEETIRMPMNAVESPGDTNIQSLADTFGQSVLALYGSELQMQRARIFDTAFGGGYARRVTLSYAFADGSILTADSIRPTSAVTLLGGSGYTLDANALYGIGGVDAARMDSSAQTVIFGQTDSAVYAITCPSTHVEELTELLRQTTLIAPTVGG